MSAEQILPWLGISFLVVAVLLLLLVAVALGKLVYDDFFK